MARLIRLFEKKRGQRRTGSNLIGSVGEAIFCGSLFLLGVLSLSEILASQMLHPDPQSFAFGVGRWLLLLVMGSFVVIGGGGEHTALQSRDRIPSPWHEEDARRCLHDDHESWC